MKRIINLTLAVLGAVLLFGCKPDPVQETADEPKLLSTTPADGTEDIEGTTLTVILKFDRNIKKPAASALQLDPEATVESIDAHDKGVYINLAGLEPGQSYTLTIPAGTLVSYADGAPYSKAISVEFSVKYSSGGAGTHYGIADVSQSLSDPNAAECARRLYSFLLDCYGSRTISGPMGGTAWETECADYLYQQTGKYPAVVGFDYIHNNWVRSPYWGPDYTDISVVKNAWQAHNIIQIGWHWCVPVSQAVAESSTITDGDFSFTTTAFSIVEALKEGTWQNTNLKSQLAQIAGYLKLLQDQNIPVIWRPLHEAAGDYGWGAWFWWGYGGAEPCKQLWKYMYELFTGEYGLHNLIWVWTVQTSRNGNFARISDLQAWYPGDAYVDIVGGDLYEAKGLTGADRFKLINDSVEGRKMVTLSEFGNLLDIDGYFAAGAPWLYFLNWCAFEGDSPALYAKNSDGSYTWNNTVEEWRSALDNPRTINRDGVPDLSTYTSPDTGWEKASTAVRNMGTGWNLGNTLDTHGQWLNGKTVNAFETGWGQPTTKPELMQMVKNAGFGAMRIPVTWYQHMDADNNIDEAWMNRVEQVVNYVLDTGMYCLLNVHHDTGTEGWLRADAAVYNNTREKYIALWRQIATRFKDYGPKLLFESFNEMLDASNNWNEPKNASSYTYINKYNQDFVNTVRATGGNNRFRNLVFNDYCASSTAAAFQALEVPEDSANGHLIAQFHSYSPWSFAMDESSGAQQTWTTQCESEVRGQISTIASIAREKGIPVIIGEYGATAARAEAEVAKQAACYVSACKENNMACFYWMLLSDGADRSVPKWTKPEVKDAIINASK